MEFLGQVKSSFIDYPDKICTVYFTGGCNLRCPYCHNSPLIRGEGNVITEDEVFRHLERRRNMLDGVCVSGGEPTLHPELMPFLLEVKKRGFLAKLDTNGTMPDVLEELIKNEAVDYVAMDIKAPFEKYRKAAGRGIDIGKVQKSISLIRKAAVDYEFRTTVCKELLTEEDILNIAKYIRGSRMYIVQNFRDCSSVLVGEGSLTPFTAAELERIKEQLVGFFDRFEVR